LWQDIKEYIPKETEHVLEQEFRHISRTCEACLEAGVGASKPKGGGEEMFLNSGKMQAFYAIKLSWQLSCAGTGLVVYSVFIH